MLLCPFVAFTSFIYIYISLFSFAFFAFLSLFFFAFFIFLLLYFFLFIFFHGDVGKLDDVIKV